MIVVHFESGLGNQMLNYAEFLAVKSAHPEEAIYCESIVYELGVEQNRINMWNGYELEKVFNIKIPNVSELFSLDEWKEIVYEIKESKFWEDGWNYSEIICDTLNRHGLQLENETGNGKKRGNKFLASVTKSRLGYMLKRFVSTLFPEILIRKKAYPESLFLDGKSNFYTGQKLLFLYKGNDIEKITQQLIRAFRFPEIRKEDDNYDMVNTIKRTNAVAIHIRRSDMLYANGYLYKYGYFKRAIRKIRKKISNPTFFVFGDVDSAKWLKDNPRRVGLRKNDSVVYVENNKASTSYRDMQLMTYCKGVIITNSTFGWWGAFLNNYPGKITISPFVNYNTTDWV